MQQEPDFDLAIASTGSGYTVHVQAAYGAGEVPAHPFTLPLDLSTLPHNRRDVGEWIKRVRIKLLADNEELRQARELGSALFERLFTREVLASFSASRAKLKLDQRLRVRLRMPASLVSLPWEMLYNPQNHEFLALANDLAVVRYLELPNPIGPLRVDGPLQLLVVLASPRGQRPIDLGRERQRIEAALARQRERGKISLQFIQGPGTLDQLREHLRQPVHVLHVLCHGKVDARRGEGVLMFEDLSGDSEEISAEMLRLLLQRRQGQTRLVLLNACLGALPANDDPFSSIGAALLRGGVPAVIAMQFEIAEDSAAELARVFYAEIAAGTPIDLALTEARQHLYGYDSHRLDWVIPVLFMRSTDGALFEVVNQEVTPTPMATITLPPLNPSDRRALRARAAVLNGRWPEVVEFYTELSREYTLPESIIADLERAQHETWLQQTTAQLEQAVAQHQWEVAVTLLEQLKADAPDNSLLTDRLQHAREQLKLATWAQEAFDLAQMAEWKAVAVLLDQIEQSSPDYTHPTIDLEDLRAHTKAQLTFAQAALAANAENWATVIELLSAVPTAYRSDEGHSLLGIARLHVLTRQANQAAQANDWKSVYELLSPYQAELDSAENAELRALFTRATYIVWFSQAKAELENAERRFDWDNAVSWLEKMLAYRPTDRSIIDRLEYARIEQKLAGLASQARLAAELGSWDKVGNWLRQIESMRRNYAHPTIDIADLQQRSRAQAVYTTAVSQAEQGNWADVITLLTATARFHDPPMKALLARAYEETQSIVPMTDNEILTLSLDLLFEDATKSFAQEQFEQALDVAFHNNWAAVLTKLSAVAPGDMTSQMRSLLLRARLEQQPTKEQPQATDDDLYASLDDVFASSNNYDLPSLSDVPHTRRSSSSLTTRGTRTRRYDSNDEDDEDDYYRTTRRAVNRRQPIRRAPRKQPSRVSEFLLWLQYGGWRILAVAAIVMLVIAWLLRACSSSS